MLSNENKTALKLITFTALGFFGTRYIAKNDKVKSILKEKPGLSSTLVSTASFLASVKLGKKVKDHSTRVGLQAGTGLAMISSILVYPYVAENLPSDLVSALEGDAGITVGTDELEAIIQTELQRRIESVLPQGVKTEEPIQIELNGNNDNEEDVYSDIDSELEGDIYSVI